MWALSGQEVEVFSKAGVCCVCLDLLIDGVRWDWFYLNLGWLKEMVSWVESGTEILDLGALTQDSSWGLSQL